VNEQNDTASHEDEDDDSALCDLANLILEECTNAAPFSDLDTAIHLFQEALNRRLAPHPLRSDSLKDLAGALVTKFSLTTQRQDFDEALLLCCEFVEESDSISAATERPSERAVRTWHVFKTNLWTYHLHRIILMLNTTALPLPPGTTQRHPI
jgi:hypothetical protein